MGNTSSLINDKTTVSFIIEPSIFDKKNNKEHYKNKVKIKENNEISIPILKNKRIKAINSTQQVDYYQRAKSVSG